jgi:hypothetical protein
MRPLILVAAVLAAAAVSAQTTIGVPGLEGTIPPELVAPVTFPEAFDPIDHLAIHLVGTTTPGLLRDDAGQTHELLRGPEIFLQSPEGWSGYWGAIVMVDEAGAAFDVVLPLEPYSNPCDLMELAGQTVDLVAGIWVLLIPGWEVVTMPTATITAAEVVMIPVVGTEATHWSGVKALFR